MQVETCRLQVVLGFRLHSMKREIEMLLLKLADGARILRLSDRASGLGLEKRLDPAESVARQKQRWQRVFAAMLEREIGAAR